MPTVTVVIPTYNRPTLVVEAIASVRRQTLADWEAVVVDDGSDEPSRAAVEGLADPRIRYVYQRNAGLAAARNAGIRLSRAPYVAFLDDDDLWLPTKLAAQVLVLDDRPEVGLVTGGWLCVDEKGATLKEVRPWQWRPNLDLHTWLYACPSVPSAVMVRREWLERAGGFDEGLRQHAEDWDLWLRLAGAGCPMAWVEEVVCAYRIQAGSMVHQAARQKQGMIAVLDKLFAGPAVPPELAAERDRIYAQAYLRGAAREYGAGQVEPARQDVARAVELDSDLVAGDGDRLFGALLAWAGDPAVGEPSRYVATVWDHLPPAAAGLAGRKREALALAARGALFDAHGRGDRGGVWHSLWAMATRQPGLLLDRGVAAVALHSLAGQRA